MRPPRDTDQGPRDRRRSRLRGQAMVEFAIVLPVFMLLLLIAVDFGRLFFSYVQISNAAREGAAFGAASPTDTVGIAAHAQQETNSQAQRGESPIVVSAACADTGGTALLCANAAGGGGPGNTVTVSVAERFTFLTPFMNGFFNNNLTLNTSASAAVLGYAPSGTSGTPPDQCAAPSVASFIVTASNLTITADPSASRPNSGVCNISGYNWDWGDGNTDVGTATASPHIYAGAGTFTVKLVVTNQGGALQAVRTVTVPPGGPPPVCTKPTASFSYTQGSGSNSKTFNFTDTSTVADPVNCPKTDWAWDLGDGTLGNAQNPSHTYATASTHTVQLIVTNAAGASAPYTHSQ